MYVIPALNRNHVINHQNPPPTPPFVKWRREKNHETSMSFPRKWESPTHPGTTKNKMPACASMTNNLAKTSSAPTARYFYLDSDCYRYSAPMGLLNTSSNWVACFSKHEMQYFFLSSFRRRWLFCASCKKDEG